MAMEETHITIFNLYFSATGNTEKGTKRIEKPCLRLVMR